MASARNLAPINATELRHICDIEQLTPGVDGTGAPLTTYTLFAANVRFAFADYRGGEAMQGKQIISQLTTYITMRYRPGIEPSMRIKHVVDTATNAIDYYDIAAQPIRDPTGRIGLLLQCVKRDAAGYRTGTVP